MTLFIDDRIGRMLEMLRQENLDSIGFQAALNDLSFLRGIGLKGPKALLFRKTICDAFDVWKNHAPLGRFILDIKDTENTYQEWMRP